MKTLGLGIAWAGSNVKPTLVRILVMIKVNRRVSMWEVESLKCAIMSRMTWAMLNYCLNRITWIKQVTDCLILVWWEVR